MLRTVDYVQLDSGTKAYLRQVRRAKGRGAPGVFEATADTLVGWALIAGLGVLTLFLWLGYSTNKSAWVAAMLQTAGVMLGGWLILFAVRKWTANPDSQAGKFVYFDPEHVFVGRGEEIQYARLDPTTTAEPAGESEVKFETEAGTFVVPTASRTVANYVADYYDALDHLRNQENGWWAGSSPAVLGALARYMVVNDRVPSNLSEVSLEIEAMPDGVRPDRRRPNGLIRYLIILAVGVGVYFAFATTNQPVHDAGAFAAVKTDSPADLRHYIADPNAPAHRDEAVQKLAALYDKKVAELSSKGNEPELRAAFGKLIDSLRGPETPAVSLGVKETTANANSNWANTLRTRLADGIGTAVGKEYVVFVHKPDDKPGLMDLTYSTEDGTTTWTLDFRLTPADVEPYYTAHGTVTGLTTNTTEALYADIMVKMVGTAPPAPVVPLEDW